MHVSAKVLYLGDYSSLKEKEGYTDVLVYIGK